MKVAGMQRRPNVRGPTIDVPDHGSVLMLDELGSYALSDFLLFSKDTYFRLFELYNQDYWPAHIPALTAGFAVLYLLLRRRRERTIRIAAGLIALAWVWIAWAFHLDRYSTINIAAPYFAVLFGVEAALLLIIGTGGGWIRKDGAPAPRAGAILLGYAVLVHPLTGLLAGRTWAQISTFGMGPDPTAIATLGVLLLVGGGVRWILLIPPVLWCAVSALTAVSMQSIEAAAPLLAAAAAICLSFRRRRKRIESSVEP